MSCNILASDNMMYKMAIVRMAGIRPFDINFFESCHQFELQFFHSIPKIATKLKSTYLFPESAFPIDPISMLKKKDPLVSLASWSYLKNLEKYLTDVDVINSIEPYFFVSKQCARISKKLNKPLVIMTAQNLITHPSRYLPPYCWNISEVIKAASLFIAMSNGAKKYLMSLGVPQSKIVVIYPGVPVSNFNPIRPNNQYPRILFVGNLFPSKGLPDLLAVDARLHSEGINHELWICGCGNLEYLVHQYTKKFPIKYLGYINHEKISDVYSQADIFCMPSSDYKFHGLKVGEEQFGFVFLEAMASGLPIVTTNSGSIPEVVGSQNLLVKKNSKNELYTALKYLLKNQQARLILGNNNRLRAEKYFDTERQSLKFEKEIIKLLD